MSGVVHVDLEIEDTGVFHEKSISPIDISSMSFSDEDWLTKPIKEEKEIPKPQINHLDEKTPKLRHRTLGPEPILPNKFHPLCYCYRLPEDFDHYPPRIYCVGEPLNDDIVIYSDVDENVTWKEFKDSKRNAPNLLKVFPHLQLKKHQEDEESQLRALMKQENKVTREIDCIKRANVWEQDRLETLFHKEIEEIKKLKFKLNRNSPKLNKKQPSLDTSAIKKDTNTSRRDARNSTTQQRRNNLKSAASLSSTSFDKHKLRPNIMALDKIYSLSDENVRDKVRKVKPPLPNYTLQERLHYERSGCTQKELEARKWQEKRLKVGVWY